eukprot:725127_1
MSTSFALEQNHRSLDLDSIAFHNCVKSFELDDVYSHLEALRLLDDVSTFRKIEEKELNQLCDEIKVHTDFDSDFIAKMRFKSAIKRYQSDNHFIENTKSFYSKYIVNDIESNVNEIKSKIDLKFKTISKTIRKTKKLLLKSIDRWKEERVCMVQQQIQSLHQDNHSQTQIIIKMKDLTERIDIKFTDHLTIMPSQSAPDYQFAEIHRFKNNCIKIPQFVLQEPEMVSLNSSSIRYKVKLKWNVQNTQQMKDIKHRDVAYYYQKDGVRDRVWRKCENLLFEEKENCVDVELAEWFKCNKTYCFKIEYHGKYPFEYTIVSPTQRYSFKTDQNALHKMKLCYLKHRGHFNDCHPMNLLFSDDTNYKSQINATFGHSCDYDWVMFKFDDKQYIPSTIFVRSHLQLLN